MNTIVLEKNENVEELRVDVFSRLLQNRIIFIDDLTTDKTAMDIVAVLLCLDKFDNENQGIKNKVTIFINSEGGDIRNVFAIYDTMKRMSSPIETFCIGSAMREAALLLSAGTKGHRVITKNSDICLSQINSQYVSHGDLTNTKISRD
jgi:ATP-dependent Clp protease protease subunit